MRPSRDLLIVLALFAVLIGLTVWSALRRNELEESQNTYTAYSTHSALRSGTLAMHHWLESLGYRAQRIENDTFQVPDDARVLFVFTTQDNFEDYEARAVVRWVEQGHTLIVADQFFLRDEPDRLMRVLQAKTKRLDSYAITATLEQPLWGAASTLAVVVNTQSALVLERPDFVQHLSANGAPVLVSWTQGRGKVFLTSAPYLFTNDSLKNEQNVPLVRALLGNTPTGSVVAFDEYHLGYNNQVTGRVSLQALLYNTPWGWAILFSFVVIFAYIVVNGQRFGRVVPLPQDIARRSPAEYVISVAQLFRRAGKRRIIMQHYHQQLKRSLGRPYRINANLPDDEFVRELARYRDDLDQAALHNTLRALDRLNVNERALVKLADESIKLRNRKSNGN
jgi:hypothetical protein